MNAPLKSESRSAMAPNRTAYDPFLGAVICEEKNGMSLTIVSALSRAGLDPFVEAARLAGLRREKAADSLVDALSRARAIAMSPAELAGVAAELVRLLPEPHAAPDPVRRRSRFALPSVPWRTATVVAAILAVAIYVSL